MKPPKNYTEQENKLSEELKKEREYIEHVQNNRVKMSDEEADILITKWNEKIKKIMGDLTLAIVTRKEMRAFYGKLI